MSPNDVRNLIREQFPQWSDLTVSKVDSHGTVNALFRLGDHMVCRFALQGTSAAMSRQLLEQESAASRELFGHTRFLTPLTYEIGSPGANYPLCWSVQSWLHGTVATLADPSHSVEFAQDLAEFVQGVRTIDVGDRRFSGVGRGGELKAHDGWMDRCFEASEGLMDVAHVRHLWRQLRELPRTSGDVMNHGDLIPANVLVEGSRLVGVIDVGGLGPADPALDLIVAWTMLEELPRSAFRHDLACSELEWARGQAWAFVQALGLIWYYQTSNLVMTNLGRDILRRILEDPAT